MNKELIVDRLKRGILHFRENVYPQNAEMYRRAAATPQQPHTLDVVSGDSFGVHN
jgi:hypothetical protein